MHGRSEFPVRLDFKAILQIKNRSQENEIVMKTLHQIGIQEIPQVQQTLQVLLAFQDYLKERHVDPGFQVVINE